MPRDGAILTRPDRPTRPDLTCSTAPSPPSPLMMPASAACTLRPPYSPKS